MQRYDCQCSSAQSLISAKRVGREGLHLQLLVPRVYRQRSASIPGQAVTIFLSSLVLPALLDRSSSISSLPRDAPKRSIYQRPWLSELAQYLLAPPPPGPPHGSPPTIRASPPTSLSIVAFYTLTTRPKSLSPHSSPVTNLISF